MVRFSNDGLEPNIQNPNEISSKPNKTEWNRFQTEDTWDKTSYFQVVQKPNDFARFELLKVWLSDAIFCPKSEQNYMYVFGFQTLSKNRTIWEWNTF